MHRSYFGIKVAAKKVGFFFVTGLVRLVADVPYVVGYALVSMLANESDVTIIVLR